MMAQACERGMVQPRDFKVWLHLEEAEETRRRREMYE